MYGIPPMNQCILCKEAISLKALNLRSTFLWIDTERSVYPTAFAGETDVDNVEQADLVARFEPSAFC